jgi:hypothetical protein
LVFAWGEEMKLTPIFILFIILFTIPFLNTTAQDDADFVKKHAVHIVNPEKLNDSVYNLLSPFQIIMFGEMHGTNESAPFVKGLVNLFTEHGDSVQLGLEIPSSQMAKFISLHTEISIYESDFFLRQPQSSGKETVAWATLISELKDNPRVHIFFCDVNDYEEKPYQRDSLMSVKIRNEYNKHSSWKMITLTGNYHNKISGEATTAFFLNKDKQFKICSLNMEYSGGTCLANFGHGLERRQLGSYPSAYNSTLNWDNFLLLVSSASVYPYHGFYYTRQITAAELTPHE